jgi:phosphomannomutase
MLTSAVFSGLLSTGCRVLDLGICPTPTIPLLVSEEKLAGGIMITASHNPPQWNGLKFISSAGAFLNDAELARLKSTIRTGCLTRAAWNNLGSVQSRPDAIDIHINRILHSKYFRNRRRRNLRIGIDACDGAASEAAVRLVRRLGSRPFPLFCSISEGGAFPRGPEPTADHLDALGDFVRSRKLDMGVAFDPDGDRFSCVDENGAALGEEASLMLATEFVLEQSPGAVVVNLSTTQGVDDIAARYGARVLRSRVGEAAVVAKIKETGAVVGGEGNGGVIIPAINTARDGLVALATLVQVVSDADKPLSQVARDLPHYVMRKDKATLPVTAWPAVKTALQREFAGAQFDRADGLKVTLRRPGDTIPNRSGCACGTLRSGHVSVAAWLHIRPSNTEPIIRIIVEAGSNAEAGRLLGRARKIITQRKQEV